MVVKYFIVCCILYLLLLECYNCYSMLRLVSVIVDCHNCYEAVSCFFQWQGRETFVGQLIFQLRYRVP
jgi:hypothetical protein